MLNSAMSPSRLTLPSASPVASQANSTPPLTALMPYLLPTPPNKIANPVLAPSPTPTPADSPVPHVHVDAPSGNATQISPAPCPLPGIQHNATSNSTSPVAPAIRPVASPPLLITSSLPPIHPPPSGPSTHVPPLTPSVNQPPPARNTHPVPHSPPLPLPPPHPNRPPPLPSSSPPLPPPSVVVYPKIPGSRAPPSPQVPTTREFDASQPPSAPSSFPVSIGKGDSHASDSGSKGFHASFGLMIGCVTGVLLLFFLFLLLCKYRKSRRNQKPPLENDYKKLLERGVPSSSHPSEACVITVQQNSEGCGSNDLAHSSPGLSSSASVFTYDELIVATNGFSESNLLGKGGFGDVHKGVLSCGKEVAVKKLKAGSNQGEREFQAEVETITRVHHKHLVSLVGYCITGAERLLVYEFVPNKTLEFHLHGRQQPVLDWDTRLKIAIGSAKGLAYLHEDCNPTIIHRDIKASNILLDSRFEAKVSDFGLAKYFSDANAPISHISTRVVGTFGYLAPEYASTGKVTEKSDVYSFGVMLIELISGRPPISEDEPEKGLVNWAKPLLLQAREDRDFDALADPKLNGNYSISEMTRMVACAAACVQQSASNRPRMSQVVRTLEGDISLQSLDNSESSIHNIQEYEGLNKLLLAPLHEITSLSDCGETSQYSVSASSSSSRSQENEVKGAEDETEESSSRRKTI
ncbi:hypothetical protein SLA2020_005530 [Shorea laevis]